MHHGQTKKIDLVWFGCPGLYRFALDYFGLLWFTLFWLRKCLESSIPWTMDRHKRKNKYVNLQREWLRLNFLTLNQSLNQSINQLINQFATCRGRAAPLPKKQDDM